MVLIAHLRKKYWITALIFSKAWSEPSPWSQSKTWTAFWRRKLRRCDMQSFHRISTSARQGVTGSTKDTGPWRAFVDNIFQPLVSTQSHTYLDWVAGIRKNWNGYAVAEGGKRIQIPGNLFSSPTSTPVGWSSPEIEPFFRPHLCSLGVQNVNMNRVLH